MSYSNSENDACGFDGDPRDVRTDRNAGTEFIRISYLS